jgi:hypothetical protein
VPKIVQLTIEQERIEDYAGIVTVDGVRYAVRIQRARLWDYVALLVREGLGN